MLWQQGKKIHGTLHAEKMTCQLQVITGLTSSNLIVLDTNRLKCTITWLEYNLTVSRIAESII